MRTSPDNIGMTRRPANLSSGTVEFLPGAPLPAQWPSVRGEGAAMPERKLMHAILTDAIDVYRKYAGQPRSREFRMAVDWLGSEDAVWPMSFIRICEALGLDPSYLRRGIKEWSLAKGVPLKLRCRTFAGDSRKIIGGTVVERDSSAFNGRKVVALKPTTGAA